jgi:FkbM family methyltransferase
VFVVSRLAAGGTSRAKLLVLGAFRPLRDRVLPVRDVRVRLRYGRTETAWTVGPSSDLDVLNEVLVLAVYETALPAEPATILDLGSHAGTSLLFWRERFPQARIVGVEPDPVTFQRLRRNVDELGVELRHVALAERDGPVDFFPARQGWVSGLWGTGEPVRAQGRTLGSLIAEIGPVDLLKVDIEGAERFLLGDPALREVGAIVGEYHDSGDAGARAAFFDGLRAHFDLTVAPVSEFMAFSGARRP